MQLSDLPPKNPIPFANAADSSHKRAIPVPSQTPTSSDAPASFTDGFPPLTFLNLGAGGIPPNGSDFNGIFNFLSAWTRWQALGGPVTYDGTFEAAVPTAGYPKGARLMSSANPAITWVSTADNNTTNPDGGSAANWVVEGDAGHSYVANSGHIYIDGKILVNFGHVGLTGTSGHAMVTFDQPFSSVILWPGAVNDCGPNYPSATAGVGNLTLTTMNVGMSVGPSTPGAFAPAGAGTAAYWWAAGI